MSIQLITSESNSLNYFSISNGTEIDNVSNGNIRKSAISFGEYSNDVLEFTILNSIGEAIVWETIYPETTFTEVSRSYVNEENVKINYAYKLEKTNYVISQSIDGNRFLLLPVYEDLKRNGLTTGNYQVYYNPIRNLVGDFESGIKVSEISPSGKELKLFCDSDSITNDFESFCKNTYKAKYWLSDFSKFLININLYSYYKRKFDNSISDTNKIKFFYNFKNDTDIVFFVYDLYNGVESGRRRSNGTPATYDILSIRNIIENLCYSKYDSPTDIEQTYNECVNSIVNIVTIELNKISASATDDFTISYFADIFNSALLDFFTSVKDSLSKSTFSPLKTFVNVGNNQNYKILNKKYETNEDGTLTLVLKLDTSVGEGLKSGQFVYISTVEPSLGVYQSVYVYEQSSIILNSLKPANFSINSRFSSPATNGNTYSQDQLKEESFQGTILNPVIYDKINVDYRYFENFIKFSSATLRLDVFKNKLTELESIDSVLENNLTDSEISTLESSKQTILNSFDGYEKFLYNNRNWYYIHTEASAPDSSNGLEYITSCSLYDKYNTDSLYNNTPSQIRELENNEEYMTFVNMIGHMFDNIWIYIDNYPRTKQIKNNDSGSLSKSIINDVIESYGWEFENGNSDLNLLQGLYNYSDSDELNFMSGNERTLEIWKRLLNSLPEILHSKGTANCIETIISCYGIPKNILKIKEYANLIAADSSVYYQNIVNFSPKIKEYDEFMETEWISGSKTLEFSFSYTDSEYKVSHTNRLVQCEDKWSIGTLKSKGKKGNIFFTIRDVSGSVSSIITDELPIFDGETYDIILKKYYPIDVTISEKLSPNKFEIQAIKINDGEIAFSTSASIFLSGSYIDMFNSGSNLIRFGNYNTVQGEEFRGTVDEIKIWSELVSQDEYITHATMFENYSSTDLEKIKNNLSFRLNFDLPLDVSTTGSYFNYENKSFDTSKIPYIRFYNFRQPTEKTFIDPVTGEEKITYYPYQFSRKEVEQEIPTKNIYTTGFGVSKVKKSIGKLESNLNPNSKSEVITDRIELTNKLGVFFSPTDYYSEKTMRSVSLIDFGNLIGSPTQTDSTKYSDLENFKRTYQKYFYIDSKINTYINNVKNFIDKSVFSQIKQSVPAKVNLVSGILIESTILERTKINGPSHKIEVQKNRSDELKVSPSPSSTLYKNHSVTISPETKGLLKTTEYFENGFIPSIQNEIGVFGQYTEFAPSGGYFYKDGEHYVIEVETYRKQLLRRDGQDQYSSSSIEREKLNVRKFPQISEIPFNGTLSGSFDGLITLDEYSQYHLYGMFKGSIASGSSVDYTEMKDYILISGSYVGTPPSSSIDSDLNAFIGKIKTIDSSDIFNWFIKNISGDLLNQINSSEKSIKYDYMNVKNALTNYSRTHANSKILRNNTRRFEINDVQYNVQSTQTTIDPDSGLLDGTLAFYTLPVDRGQVSVYNQGAGNILSSN